LRAKRQRRAVLRERRGKLAAAVMNFGDAADGCEIFGCALEDRRELGQRLVELVQLDQRTAERDAGREIRRVYREAGATDVNRFLVLPARRHSSASCAKAIDAGSFWTRRRRSSIR